MASRIAKTFIAAISAVLLISVPTLGASAATPKAGGSCATLNQVVVSSNVKYQCVKSGSKKVWKKLGSVSASTPVNTPTPTPTPTLPPLPLISDLTASVSSAGISYSWSAPAGISNLKYYEVGIAWLLTAGADGSKSANYTAPVFFKVAQTSPAVIGFSEAKSYLATKLTDLSGQAFLIRVRSVTDSQTSGWGNGIFTTVATLDSYIASYSSSSGGSGGNSGSGGNTGSGGIKTYNGYGTVSCPAGTKLVSGGMGTIPPTVWKDLLGAPLQYVHVRNASGRIFANSYIASGTETIYQQQSNGSFVAPTGARYFVFGIASYDPPVWVQCG